MTGRGGWWDGVSWVSAHVTHYCCIKSLLWDGIYLTLIREIYGSGARAGRNLLGWILTQWWHLYKQLLSVFTPEVLPASSSYAKEVGTCCHQLDLVKMEGNYRALSLTKFLVYNIIHCQVSRAISHPNLAHLEGFSFQRRYSPHLSPPMHSLRGADPLSAVDILPKFTLITAWVSKWWNMCLSLFSQPAFSTFPALYRHELIEILNSSVRHLYPHCTDGALESWTCEVPWPRQKTGEDLHQICSRPTLKCSTNSFC